MMIEEKINSDLKEAMKARDKGATEAIRSIKKAVIEAKTSKGAAGDIQDADIIKIIQKLAKQGKDSADIYKNQNREDLYEQEMEQVKVFEKYLPKQLSEEELTERVKAIISNAGATSMKEMGKVMGIASKELAGIADGKLISQKVRELLA